MLRLEPFLLFQGNCAEAMSFYHAALGGELTLTRLGDTPMAQGFPPEQHGKVTYASLNSSLIELSATDWLHPTHQPVVGNTVALLLSGDEAQLRAAFDALAAGAASEFFVPLQPMPFGLYGRFTDRFGVEWFFRGEPAPSSEQVSSGEQALV